MGFEYEKYVDPETGETERRKVYPVTFTDEADLNAYMQPFQDHAARELASAKKGARNKLIISALIAFGLGIALAIEFVRCA